MQKTDGIVLRRMEVRETSLLLTCFTRDLGKVRGLVKGVRGSRAAVPWLLEPLTLQHLVVYERRRSPWALIGGCDLVDGFDALRRDLERTAYGLLFLDLVDAMTEVGDPHPEIFHLLLGALRALEAPASDPRSIARFVEARLLRAGGHLPDSRSLALTAQGRAALQRILEHPPARCADLRLAVSEEAELRRLLRGLLHRVLEKELNSRLFLLSLGLERTSDPSARGLSRVA